jgi:hypothetical protein
MEKYKKWIFIIPAKPADKVLLENIANNAAKIVIRFPIISKRKASHLFETVFE